MTSSFCGTFRTLSVWSVTSPMPQTCPGASVRCRFAVETRKSLPAALSLAHCGSFSSNPRHSFHNGLEPWRRINAVIRQYRQRGFGACYGCAGINLPASEARKPLMSQYRADRQTVGAIGPTSQTSFLLPPIYRSVSHGPRGLSVSVDPRRRPAESHWHECRIRPVRWRVSW
jgi:hypothetical protein